MSERATLMVAVAAFVGSLNAHPIPLWLGVVVAVAALISLRASLAVLTVLLLCSSLAWNSWDGLEPEEPTTVDAVATLVTDPVRSGRQTTAVMRVGGTRYLASAFGGAAARLQGLLAGERIAIQGSTRAYNGSRERRAALHVANRLTIVSVEQPTRASPPWLLANAIRSRIDSGAASLGSEQKAVFTGLVYGDDRHQSPLTEVDFRLVGLTHLLAVSGQNVAYVLAVLGPVIRRRSLPGRWFMTILVLAIFATATRFEPSVLRATVMASLAATAHVLGRDAPTARLLAMAVTLLLLVDPLLAETMAFRLSVAASAGIVWLSRPIERRMPGPSALRAVLSVTVGAQLAVSPLLVAAFGPVSIVSIPANVVAGPLAGAIMAWGMTAGFVAGIVPPQLAAVIHLPTRFGLVCLEQVAEIGASLPLASVSIAWIVVACAVAATARRWWNRRLQRVAAICAGAALLATLIPQPIRGAHTVGFDSELDVSAGKTTLTLGSEGDGVRVAVDLLRMSVRQIDVLVIGEKSDASSLTTVTERIAVGQVVEAAEASSSAVIALD